MDGDTPTLETLREIFEKNQARGLAALVATLEFDYERNFFYKTIPIGIDPNLPATPLSLSEMKSWSDDDSPEDSKDSEWSHDLEDSDQSFEVLAHMIWITLGREGSSIIEDLHEIALYLSGEKKRWPTVLRGLRKHGSAKRMLQIVDDECLIFAALSGTNGRIT